MEYKSPLWDVDNLTTNTTISTPSNIINFSVGDVNNDEIVDIAIIQQPDSLKIYSWNGSEWINIESLVVGNNPCDVIIGDVNNDGYNDIVTANTDSNNLTILQRDKENSTWIYKEIKLYASPNALAIGDIDNDWDTDIITANHNANNISTLRWNDTTWIPGEIENVNKDISSLIVSNPDNDDYNDIIGIVDNGPQNNGTMVIIREINNNWNINEYETYMISPKSVFVFDINHDEDKDIIITNHTKIYQIETGQVVKDMRAHGGSAVIHNTFTNEILDNTTGIYVKEGIYKYYIRARISDGWDGSINVTAIQGNNILVNGTVFELTLDYKWYVTEEFDASYGVVKLNITDMSSKILEKPKVYLDYIVLARSHDQVVTNISDESSEGPQMSVNFTTDPSKTLFINVSSKVPLYAASAVMNLTGNPADLPSDITLDVGDRTNFWSTAGDFIGVETLDIAIPLNEYLGSSDLGDVSIPLTFSGASGKLDISDIIVTLKSFGTDPSSNEVLFTTITSLPTELDVSWDLSNYVIRIYPGMENIGSVEFGYTDTGQISTLGEGINQVTIIDDDHGSIYVYISDLNWARVELGGIYKEVRVVTGFPQAFQVYYRWESGGDYIYADISNLPTDFEIELDTEHNTLDYYDNNNDGVNSLELTILYDDYIIRIIAEGLAYEISFEWDIPNYYAYMNTDSGSDIDSIELYVTVADTIFTFSAPQYDMVYNTLYQSNWHNGFSAEIHHLSSFEVEYDEANEKKFTLDVETGVSERFVGYYTNGENDPNDPDYVYVNIENQATDILIRVYLKEDKSELYYYADSTINKIEASTNMGYGEYMYAIITNLPTYIHIKWDDVDRDGTFYLYADGYINIEVAVVLQFDVNGKPENYIYSVASIRKIYASWDLHSTGDLYITTYYDGTYYQLTGGVWFVWGEYVIGLWNGKLKYIDADWKISSDGYVDVDTNNHWVEGTIGFFKGTNKGIYADVKFKTNDFWVDWNIMPPLFWWGGSFDFDGDIVIGYDGTWYAVNPF